MKNILFIIICNIVNINYIFPTYKNCDINIIILIDDEVVYSVANMKIISHGEKEITYGDTDYYPGCLNVEQFKFHKDTNKDEMLLNFTYFETQKSNIIAFEYSIPISKQCLQEDYIILKIYNLNKGKFKRIYKPLSEFQNYTFEINSPNCTFKRIGK